MTTVAYPHIEIRSDGVPYIASTETKVVELVMSHLAYNWDAEEIHRQHPDLRPGQIYSALAFYHDNREEIDADIQQRLIREQQLLDQYADQSLQLKLRTAKRISMGLQP